MKRCTKCLQEKPETAFRFRHDTKKLRAECRVCLANRNRQWRKEHPGYKGKWRRENQKLNAEYQYRAAIKRRYGLKETDVDALMTVQDGKCAICSRMLVGKPHIDHNHDTNIVRGLLCRPCNRGIGMFKDKPELLLEAVKYLKERNEWHMNPFLELS